jgi:hypothetical protein
MGTANLCHGWVYFFSQINLLAGWVKLDNPATAMSRQN